VTGRSAPVLRVLSVAWLRPLGAEDWPTVATVPDLAMALPVAEPRAVADLAAEHRRLTVRDVPPIEGGFWGTPEAADEDDRRGLAPLYAEGGWALDPGALGGAPGDHLAVELLALDAFEARGAVQAARHLVVEHLAVWVPALAWALRRIAPPPFYAALAEMTLDNVLARLERAGGGRPAIEPAPPPADRSADPVAAAVGALLTPSRCGCWISLAELQRIAQWLAVPVSLTSRRETLLGLLDASVGAGQSRRLLTALDDLVDDARLDFDGLAEAYPAWEPYRRWWASRLDGGSQAVRALARSLGEPD
jgi:hypothetical protein